MGNQWDLLVYNVADYLLHLRKNLSESSHDWVHVPSVSGVLFTRGEIVAPLAC